MCQAACPGLCRSAEQPLGRLARLACGADLDDSASNVGAVGAGLDLGDHGVANGLDRGLLGDFRKRVPVITGRANDFDS
jgi:hypothetical protein